MKNKEILEKTFFEKVRSFIPVVIFFFGLFTIVSSNSIRDYNAIFLSTSLGFLTFISIFFPLIVQKDIKEKRDVFTKNYSNQVINKIDNSIKLLKELINKNDINKISKRGKDIQEMLESLTNFNEQMNIQKILFNAIVSLVLSTILIFSDLIFSPHPLIWQESTIYYLIWPGYFCFWFGINKSVALIFSWNDIVSNRLEEKFN